MGRTTTMTLTLDINVLVARTDVENAHHARALKAFDELLRGDEFVYLFWPVVVGYVRVVTRPGLLRAPLTLAAAFENVDRLLQRPFIRVGAEGGDFWLRLRAVAQPLPARGKLIHDAHLAALMHQHAVPTIWTNDRDFRKFDGIHVVDPFAD